MADIKNEGNVLRSVLSVVYAQEEEQWNKLSDSERRARLDASERGKQAIQRRNGFEGKFLKSFPFNEEDRDLTLEFDRILEEYTPVLEGEGNGDYGTFPDPNVDNFMLDRKRAPCLIVHKVDSSLGHIVEIVRFEDFGGCVRPEPQIVYRDSRFPSRDETVTGFYMPVFLTRIEDGEAVSYTLPNPNDADIFKYLESRGFRN